MMRGEDADLFAPHNYNSLSRAVYLGKDVSSSVPDPGPSARGMLQSPLETLNEPTDETYDFRDCVSSNAPTPSLRRRHGSHAVLSKSSSSQSTTSSSPPLIANHKKFSSGDNLDQRRGSALLLLRRQYSQQQQSDHCQQLEPPPPQLQLDPPQDELQQSFARRQSAVKENASRGINESLGLLARKNMSEDSSRLPEGSSARSASTTVAANSAGALPFRVTTVGPWVVSLEDRPRVSARTPLAMTHGSQLRTTKRGLLAGRQFANTNNNNNDNNDGNNYLASNNNSYYNNSVSSTRFAHYGPSSTRGYSYSVTPTPPLTAHRRATTVPAPTLPVIALIPSSLTGRAFARQHSNPLNPNSNNSNNGFDKPNALLKQVSASGNFQPHALQHHHHHQQQQQQQLQHQQPRQFHGRSNSIAGFRRAESDGGVALAHHPRPPYAQQPQHAQQQQQQQPHYAPPPPPPPPQYYSRSAPVALRPRHSIDTPPSSALRLSGST